MRQPLAPRSPAAADDLDVYASPVGAIVVGLAAEQAELSEL
jgi:hypothetical protein